MYVRVYVCDCVCICECVCVCDPSDSDLVALANIYTEVLSHAQ